MTVLWSFATQIFTLSSMKTVLQPATDLPPRTLLNGVDILLTSWRWNYIELNCQTVLKTDDWEKLSEVLIGSIHIYWRSKSLLLPLATNIYLCVNVCVWKQLCVLHEFVGAVSSVCICICESLIPQFLIKHDTHTHTHTYTLTSLLTDVLFQMPFFLFKVRLNHFSPFLCSLSFPFILSFFLSPPPFLPPQTAAAY